MNFFNKNLRYTRKRLAVSQEELALQAKVRSTTISNYENGTSKPGLEEALRICHFFGVSLDQFCYQNFEEGNVITDEAVSEFKRNGKLNGKVIGNPSGKKNTNYEPQEQGLSTVKEGEETMMWAVLQAVKQIDGKIDVVRAGVDELRSKKEKL